MKIVYIDGFSPSEDIEKACSDLGMFKYANMDGFVYVDKNATEVFTDNPKIKDAYKDLKVEVKPLPSGKIVVKESVKPVTLKKPNDK